MNIANSQNSGTPHQRPFRPSLLISGGQTGVDRAGLDAAIFLSIPHGGACPAGRLAEDGRIPDKYQMTELASAKYPPRTAKNVVDADATLILYRGQLSGGTLLTQRLCQREHKPFLSVSIENRAEAISRIQNWLGKISPDVLNIAGPRESNAMGISDECKALLIAVFS